MFAFLSFIQFTAFKMFFKLQVSQIWSVFWSFLAVERLHELATWVHCEQQVHLLFLQLADSDMKLQDLPNRYEAWKLDTCPSRSVIRADLLGKHSCRRETSLEAKSSHKDCQVNMRLERLTSK